MAEHNDLGKWGEQYAAEYLQKQGYLILNRDWRYGRSLNDIDIICKTSDLTTVVFVEVKTRTGLSYGKPAAAVNYAKQRKIIRTAQWYLLEKHLSDCRCRFDVIEVYAMTAGAWKVRQIEGAFEM